MISKIKAKHFQSYNDLNLELDNKVNTIVGVTDSGKSTIIRLIKLIATNKPNRSAKFSFITDRKKLTLKASILFDNKTKIQRIKDNKNNIYKLNEKKFEDIGKTVPNSIERIINIIPWINIQNQHDPPFFISDTISKSEISKRLNLLVNLDDIDKSIQNIKEKKREVSTKEKIISEELESKKKKIKSLFWVDEAFEKIKIIKIKEANIKNLKKYLEELIEINNRIKTISKEKEDIKLIPKDEYRKTIDLHDSIKKKYNRLKVILGLKTKLVEINQEKENINLIPEQIIVKIENINNSIIAKKIRLEKISKLVNTRNTIRENINSEERKNKDILKELKEIGPKICPTCKQYVNNWRM